MRALLATELHAQLTRAEEQEFTARQLDGQMDADSVLERELALAAAARAREAIEEIGHALERVDAGTHGLCEACGRPIPFERLEAIPQARLCVACPPRRETSGTSLSVSGWPRS